MLLRYNQPVNFHKSTSTYETWLSQQLEIVPDDLAAKHKTMRAAVFPFFRATFYRWAQLFPEVCAECADAPQLLAVGDLHVENFGTWRDIEGRLVWGINDFDEASRMPYTIDLVRLAASAHLAIDTEQLSILHRDACAQILAGYKECLKAGGLPWVLGVKHAWLLEMVQPSLRDPVGFWQKLAALPPYKGRVPGNARRGIEKMMPAQKPGKQPKGKIAHRIAGMGSLGRQRFVTLTEYEGGPTCREAKALATSAWDWARGARFAADPLSESARHFRPRARSFRAIAGPLDRAPPRARLLQNRTRPFPEGEGRIQIALRHGMGNGKRAPRLRAHERRAGGPQQTPRQLAPQGGG